MERQIPKNVRQIGNVSDSPKIYVEDYVDTFFAQLSDKYRNDPQKPLGAFLIGDFQTYEGLYRAIQTGEGLEGTVEFFPEEGKYHFDGHRKCGVSLSPVEAERLGGICPVCGKKLTMGVDHRVEQLADRAEGFVKKDGKKYESLVPLPEVISACMGYSTASKKVQGCFEQMIQTLGTEFDILRNVPSEDIKSCAGERIAEGIENVRTGNVKRIPGYDGEYGKIELFDEN